MRKFSLSALAALLVAALAVTGTAFSAGPASAAAPDPSLQDTARLLGYMWGDGTKSGNVWDVNGPSGSSSLVEELVEAHGGTWVNRSKLMFELPAPYNWADWQDGLPDNSAWVRSAVQNHNFLAAVMETEAAVEGQIYDQSACCVAGFTFGRLTELRDLMRDRGFSTAKIVRFNNVDSGKVEVAESDFAKLRAAHKFVCPTGQSAIRIPGGTDLGNHGNLRWIQAGERWSDVVRTDCPIGRSVPSPQAQTGSCSVRADGSTVTVEWTFTLGDAVVRRDGRYVETPSGRDQTWSETRPNGTYNYELRLIAFKKTTNLSCGTVTVGGDVPPPPPPPPPPPGGDDACVAVVEDGLVRLSWDDFGKARYSIRRNNGWAGSITDGSRTFLVSGSINDDWAIRYNDGGQRATVPCPSGDNPPPPNNNAPCTVTQTNDGVLVTWDLVPGGNTYVVRRNNAWLATEKNTTSYVDSFGSVNDSYDIRIRRNGVQSDIACE